MKRKFSIDSAKYGIVSLSVSEGLVDIETEKAQQLKNIILAFIFSGNTSGPSLGIDVEANDTVLQISGNLENALLLLKEKEFVSEADMTKIFNDDAVMQLIHEAKQTQESEGTSGAEFGRHK